MDNKQEIEMIKVLQDFHSTNEFTDVPLNGKDNQALDKAIASLEAWDKVKEDIKHSQFIFLDGDKEIECIPIFEVMNIINRNLGGEVAKNESK